MQSGKLSESQFIDINEESGCVKKDAEEVILAKLHINGTF